jgi:recombination protein RecT
MSKELTSVDSLKRTLTSMATQFKAALPPHIPHERFVRVIQTAISQNPALVKADRTSFLSACMRLAEKGLEPNGADAALVMFGEKVTPMVMIAGLLRLIRNSGELKSITSQLVYKNDKFKYYVDSEGEHIEHEPNLFSDRGDMIGCYAIARTNDNGIYIEVMTMADIEKIKKSSRSAGSGPWVSWFDQMAKKSVLRRLAKRLPSSTDIEQVLSDDDKAEFVNDQPAQASQQPEQQDDAIDVSPAPEAKKSKLEKIVEASEVPI